MDEETLEALEKLKWMEGMEWMETINNLMSPDAMQMAQWFSIANNFVSIIFFLLTSWGIYMLAKKMNLKRAWMSWVPLLQYYPMAQAGGKGLMTHFVYPIIAMTVSIILLIMLGAIWGWIMWESANNWPFAATLMIVAWIIVFIAAIYMLIKYIQVLSGISKNTWRWGWTTAGLFFVGFIMFPVVGYKYEWREKKIEDTAWELKEETKVEL